jgi:hypothetical protein
VTHHKHNQPKSELSDAALASLRLSSRTTDEWAYVLKPQLAGMVLYVKLILRSDAS